jgi:membrane protein YqaA with SNARE-associated domain
MLGPTQPAKFDGSASEAAAAPSGLASEPGSARLPVGSRWSLHKRMYNWVLSFAHARHATWALFVFSFTEAIFFPIPPLVLQIPMSLERRGRTWWYATVSTVGSVLGGLVGYEIGNLFTEPVQRWFPLLFSPEHMAHAKEFVGGLAVLTGGAIAVHPFKLFTIAMGILHVDVVNFVLASVIGRGALFFGVAVLIWFFGPGVRRFIERYFTLLTVLLGLAVIGIVVLAGWR